MLRKLKKDVAEELRKLDIVTEGKKIRVRLHALLLTIGKLPKRNHFSLAKIHIEQCRMILGNAMEQASPERDPYKPSNNTRLIRKEDLVVLPTDLTNILFFIPELDPQDELLIQYIDKIRKEINEILEILEKMHMAVSYVNVYTPAIMLFLERAFIDLTMARNFISKELGEIALRKSKNGD